MLLSNNIFILYMYIDIIQLFFLKFIRISKHLFSEFTNKKTGSLFNPDNYVKNLNLINYRRFFYYRDNILLNKSYTVYCRSTLATV